MSISYILSLYCQCVCLYFPRIMTSPHQQGRRTGNEAGRECSLPRGRDVKQEWESLQEPFRHLLVSPLGPRDLMSLPLLGFCFFPFFLQTAFPRSQGTGERWLRSGALQRIPRVEFLGERWWPPWVRVPWMFLRRSQRREIVGWSLTSEVSVSWVQYSRVHTVLSPKH